MTADEQSWLDNYEATKRKPGRPVGSRKEVSPEDLPETLDFDGGADDQTVNAAPNNWEPGPPRLVDDLPSPPRIVMNEARERSSGGDWRSKYRNAEGGGKLGREGTCVLVASYWVGFLKGMEDALRLAGIEPIIQVDHLAPAIVLTVDELLPDHVEFSPRVVAVGGSTALAVQRFMKRDEIAKVQKKAKERQDFDEWRKYRSEPAEPTDIASHPDYKPKPAEQAAPEAAAAPTQPKAPSPPPITLPPRQAIQAAGRKDPVDENGVW